MRTFIALFLIAISAMNTPARASNDSCFDDAHLSAIQTQSPRGALVYVWSPRMVYSVQQLQLVARMAAAHGLDFVAVHDARVPKSQFWSDKSKAPPSQFGAQLEEHIKQEVQDLATPPFVSITDSSLPLCAAALLDNEALRHFPTAFIITAKGVHRHAIVGAMPPAAWHASIAQRLQQR